MIDLLELKKYLIISTNDNTRNDQLDLAIKNAVGILTGYLGYSLELNASKVAFFDGTCNTFELKETYINAVSKIEYGVDEFTSSFTTYVGDKNVNLERGLVKTRDNIGPYTKITYSYGYELSTTPEDLKIALYEIAAMSFKNMGKVSMGDLKSESIDGDQFVFKDITGRISENTRLTLNKYKSYGFSS